MSQQRIKGQEAQIIIVRAGVVEDTLTDIQNFNVELDIELKSEGYLGETTNRYDEVFNGAKFDFEMHIHSQKYFQFAKAVRERARRIQPDLEINIVVVLAFPNGETPTVTLPNVSFGSLPMNIPARGDYVKVKVSGACGELDEDLS